MRRIAIDGWLWAGLLLAAGGCACLGLIVLLHIGRDGGGPILLMAAMMGCAVGALCAFYGFIRMKRRARRAQLPESGISK